MAEFKPRRRKKVCAMCEGHVLDYKNAEDLKKYNNDLICVVPFDYKEKYDSLSKIYQEI